MEMIENKICDILSKTLGREITSAEMKQNGLESLHISSITFLTLITNIENAFDFEFDDDEINYEMFGDFERFCCTVMERTENKDGIS